MPRILVLDDDEPLGQTLCEALSTDGHDPYLSTSLPFALELLDGAPVDLILTNVGRSAGDELDLSRVQVLRERVPDAKIVVFTGHAQARSLDLEQLGIFAVLPKPADLNQLMAVINEALD